MREAPAEILLATLALHGSLNAPEQAAIRALRYRVHRFKKGETVVRGGATPQESCFVMTGIASREMMLPKGARQMVGIYIKGGCVDLHAYLLDQLEHDVVSLTDLSVAFISHYDIEQVIVHPTVNRLLWRLIAVDAAIQRMWLASMGRRQAAQRLAHFLCEQYARMRSQDLVNQGSFELPISQATLGDVLGLSAVHMNRSLQALRKTELVTWEGSRVTIAPMRLTEMCGFEPSYLNLKPSAG